MNIAELIRERQAILKRRRDQEEAEETLRSTEDKILAKIKGAEEVFRKGFDLTRVGQAQSFIDIKVKDSFSKNHDVKMVAVMKSVAEMAVLGVGEEGNLIEFDWVNTDYHSCTLMKAKPRTLWRDAYMQISLKDHVRSRAVGEGRIPNEMLDPILYYLWNWWQILKIHEEAAKGKAR